PNKPPQDGSYREQPQNRAVGGTLAKAASGSEEIRGVLDANRAVLESKAVPGAVDPANRQPQYIERRKQDMARQRRNTSLLQGLTSRESGRQSRGVERAGRFDREKWDAELIAALGAAIVPLVHREAEIFNARLAGFGFDDTQVAHYLAAMVEGTALGLN